ncbi:hypothetical protein LEMLEM_LOCUS22091 [Lemmus lemmus]
MAHRTLSEDGSATLGFVPEEQLHLPALPGLLLGEMGDRDSLSSLNEGDIAHLRLLNYLLHLVKPAPAWSIRRPSPSVHPSILS